MGFFTNKHVLVALIVAPLLAIVSYFTVDLFVKEQPHTAREGSSYPLVAQSNCRYASGRCDLKNNEFLAQVRVDQLSGKNHLVVSAEHVIQQVNVGFSREGGADLDEPRAMLFNSEQSVWELEAPIQFDQNTHMMIVLQANNVKYYADTVMTFSQYRSSLGN